MVSLKKLLRLVSYLAIVYLLVESLNLRTTVQDSPKQVCQMTHYLDKSVMTVNDFNCFDQLNFTQCTQPIRVQLLELKPNKNKKLILDRLFNLTGLVVRPFAGFFSILFRNLNGIDLQADPINGLKFTNGSIDAESVFISIQKANFFFYLNGKPLDSSCCDLTKSIPFDKKLNFTIW